MMARRVLIKDLRCGVSEKTINKVVGKSDWRIPVFTCQLAQDSEGHPGKMRGRKLRRRICPVFARRAGAGRAIAKVELSDDTRAR